MMAGSEAPIGRNILDLVNIQQSENYSCIAASTLGTIEAVTFVRVQGTYIWIGLTLSIQFWAMSVVPRGVQCWKICKYYLRGNRRGREMEW